MTVYNEEQYLPLSLQSILDQSYQNIEIIIVDDASTDNTPAIIASFAQKDNRIRAYFRGKNTGPCTCSNFAFKYVTGKYIARMDADDIAHKRRIEKQVAFMENHPEVGMSGTQSSVIDEYGKRISTLKYPTSYKGVHDALFVITPILHPTSMYRTDIRSKFNITYKKKYPVGNDLLFMFDFLQYGSLANIPYELLKRRVVSESITHSNPKQSFWEAVAVRHYAVRKLSYEPSRLGIIIHGVEIITVVFIPRAFIAPIYYFIRRVTAKPLSSYRLGITQTLRSLFTRPIRAFYSTF